MKLTRDQTVKEKQTERYFKKLVGDDEWEKQMEKENKQKQRLKWNKVNSLNSKDTEKQTNRDNKMM